MRVLIPVDGSEASLRTIREAATFLDTRTTSLYLFTVHVSVPAELPWGFYAKDAEERANAILQEAETEARNANLSVVLSEHRISHEPASAICDYAKEKDIDLIVMGSHGYQGLTKVLLGSVSERVFKEAEQPVAIIRNDKAHTVEISHFEKTHLKESG